MPQTVHVVPQVSGFILRRLRQRTPKLEFFKFYTCVSITSSRWPGFTCEPVWQSLLAVVKTSGADYLITGDKDLLALVERYSIVTPAQFWTTHAGL